MREWAAISHCRFEPDNEYGREAIRTELPGLGQVGYGADSPRTAPDESMRAGRLYDRMGDEAEGAVLCVLPGGVLCRLNCADPRA